MDISSKQIVLDLETLSTRSNAAIVSIGAVAIDNLEIVDEFYVNVDPKTCKDVGLHIDPITIEWWAEQDRETREALQINPVPLQEALDKFVSWYGSESIPIWGFGANFDVVIMESALQAEGITAPWKFWDIYCLRTLSNVLDRRLPKKNNHNALDDAKAEANLLIDILDS
tara:strand:- start:520 stop:1029 length:510 start_codon:yes stop_codon:yes gene_type:complete